MTLLLNNEDVNSLLTMEVTLDTLWDAYQDLWKGEAVCRPRIDIRIPTSDPKKVFQFGTMEGGSTAGYFAIRMKSDIMWQNEYEGTRTLEWYCLRPGKFCGLVFLFSIENGELLAIMNDGHLQHMRTGADAGIGAKLMAKKDAVVVGMIGSGGMARSSIAAFVLVRNITRLQVYSPTKEHREEYARAVADRYGIEALAVDSLEGAHSGADILAECSDAVIPTILGKWIEPGTHIVTLGSGGMDGEALRKIDKALRFGNAPAPLGLPEFGVSDTLIAYVARAEDTMNRLGQRGRRGRARNVIEEMEEGRVLYLPDLLTGSKPGRLSDQEVTYSDRGNLQGMQFFPIAGKIYEQARAQGLGREIPTEWFLQDIRN